MLEKTVLNQLDTDQSKPQVMVTGASSIIGQPVAQQLVSAGYQVMQISRNSVNGSAVSWDMTTGAGEEEVIEKISSVNGFYLVHCAPIWLLQQRLEWLISAGLRRAIVFSSSSIDGKGDSNSHSEQNIVQMLKTAEENAVKICEMVNVDLTIFRPTMIYGYGQGQNLAFIAKIIKRFRCFPVASPALGLRQPVHADDLAKAVAQAIGNQNTYAKKYTLSGAEALPYKEVVKRVFIALDQTPRIIALNGRLYRFALSLLCVAAKLFNKSLPIDPAMADRMQQDLSFDHSSATHDFGYKPNTFLPNGALDVVKLTSQTERQA